MDSPRLRGSDGPLRFSAYVPAENVTRLLSSAEGLDEAIRLWRANGVTKVYLDCLRGGHFPGEQVLSTARDTIRQAGIGVAAGITPTAGTGKASTHGRWWLCYTNRSTQRELADIVTRTARLFDELIVDDFLCTQCQCDECRDARGTSTWVDYYASLMRHIAAECILGPARAVNPDIHVVIKYPQWYDRFHAFGYDVTSHPSRFDEVWVGTEIRDTLVEYVHPYQAFANYSWLASLSGERIGGAWFDFINCYPERYVEQAVQSVLAGARECIRFHYDPALWDPAVENTAALLRETLRLARLADALGSRRAQGVTFVKPTGSDGRDETYLPDYLGMLGLPLVMAHEFPVEADAVCLAVHAAGDADLSERALAFARSGGTLLLTPGYVEAMAHDTHVLEAAGLASPPVARSDSWTFRFAVGGARADGEAHVRFSARPVPAGANTLASAICANGSFPVLTSRAYGQGTVHVLNTTTFQYAEGSGRVTTGEPVSLPHLPQAVVDAIRTAALPKAPVSVSVRSQVGVYRFGDLFVLCNFNDQAVSAVLSSATATDGPIVDPTSGERVASWQDGETTVRIPRRDYVVLRVGEGAM
ncbi:hypothetical protein FJZ36_00490 [Candidatus Poribacteria bacterium]|nr:hypothetical protein [Candidatus Poribacteria bacterium]